MTLLYIIICFFPAQRLLLIIMPESDIDHSKCIVDFTNAPAQAKDSTMERNETGLLPVASTTKAFRWTPLIVVSVCLVSAANQSAYLIGVLDATADDVPKFQNVSCSLYVSRI